jgi:hypothetical protein
MTFLETFYKPVQINQKQKYTRAFRSFGVTLFELFTFGDMPYGDLSNNEALMAVISGESNDEKPLKILSPGVRPSVPAKCPEAIAELMKDCWKTAPDERPVAEDALIRLKMIQ